jgi:hypothetical protein
MNELPDVGPAAPPSPETVAESAADEYRSSPEGETKLRDYAYAAHLVNNGLLGPIDGYTFAIYREQIVDKGKDYRRLMNRVTKKFGIAEWQVVLIDEEFGIM